MKEILKDHLEAGFKDGKVMTTFDLLGAMEAAADESVNEVDDMLVGWIRLALAGKEWHTKAAADLKAKGVQA